MTTYRWDRHYIQPTNVGWVYEDTGEYSFAGTVVTMYKNITANSLGKLIELTPTWSGSEARYTGDVAYFDGVHPDGSGTRVIWRYTAKEDWPNASDTITTDRHYALDTDYTASKGSYISSVTSTYRSSYSDNGVSGEYWYVYVGVDNYSPSTPGAFTSPNADIKAGETIHVDWGASSDSDGDSLTYYLEVSYNNANYTSVGNTVNSTLNYTITTDSTLTNITFRVKAYDGKEYSSYSYSNSYNIIHNTTPTVTLTTMDALAISDGQSFTIPKNTSYGIYLTASDTDTSDTLQYSTLVGTTTIQAYTGISKDTKTSVIIPSTNLVSGSNTVYIKAKDNNGAEVTRNFILNVDPNLPSGFTCLADLKFNGYSKTTISLAELIDHA